MSDIPQPPTPTGCPKCNYRNGGAFTICPLCSYDLLVGDDPYDAKALESMKVAAWTAAREAMMKGKP